MDEENGIIDNPFLKEALLRNHAASYDSEFLNDNPFLQESLLRNQNSVYPTNFNPTIFTGRTGIGDSMFDKRSVPFSQLDELNEIRAQRQPWVAKAGAGLGRVGVKVAAELLKMPGVLGGVVGGAIGQINDAITGEDNTDFVKTAFDNAWINAITDVEEIAKEELLPVYVKKAVQDGKLVDKIFSVDFWATDGADGLGYILSMLVPGMVITKGNLGAKAFGMGKLARMAKNTEKATKVMNKYGATPKQADLFSAALANTLFESAAEAKGAMDGYRHKLDAQLESGEITQDHYDELIRRESKLGAEVFGSNAGILFLPNLIMAKMLWGGTRNKAASAIASEGGMLQAIKTPKISTKIGRVVKDYGLAGSREGFWEEGMQSTVEKYFSALNENPEEFNGSLLGTYFDNLKSTDGQVAIFLGAFYGGGMQAYHGAKQRKAERQSNNRLIELGNSELSKVYNLFSDDRYVKDENGNVKYDDITGKPVRHNKKIIEAGEGLNSLDLMSIMYDNALEVDDKETVEFIRDRAVTQLIKHFLVNDNLGIKALEENLKQSDELIKMNEREGIDNNEFIKKVIGKATKLKEAYNQFQGFAPSVIKFQNENATKQDEIDYYNKLSDMYINNKSNKYIFEDKLKEKIDELDVILEDSDISYNTLEDKESDVAKSNLINSDSRFKKVYREVKDLKAALQKTKDTEKSFWDSKSAQEQFDTEVAKRIKADKDQEDARKVDEILEKIKNVKTESELDEIDNIENSLGAVTVAKRKVERKEELAKEKDRKDTQVEEASEETSQENQRNSLEKQRQIDFLKDNYNVGEEVTIPESFDFEEGTGQTATITAKDEDFITLKTEEGTEIIVPNEAFFDEFYDSSVNYSSEGGTGTVQEVEIDETSGNVYEKRNDARIMITDNTQSGNKLEFVSDAALNFELNPVDKTKDNKGFEVNKNLDITTTKIEGSDLVFNENPLLSNIGNKEQYSNYLDTIFPSSKAKDIFYHGYSILEGRTETNKFDGFNTNGKNRLNGIYLTKDFNYATEHSIKHSSVPQLTTMVKDNGVVKVVVNVANPIYKKETIFQEDINIYKNNDSIIGNDTERDGENELVIFNPNQIHILGSKKDIEGFKKYMKSQPKSKVSVEVRDALNMELTMENLDFLIDYLPINIKLTEDIVAPLETRSKSKEYNTIFDKTTRVLREAIIKELVLNNTDITNITTKITGQWNGSLQISPLDENGEVAEHSLLGLYEIGKDIKNIKVQDIFVVNDLRSLVNFDGTILPTNRPLAPGEIYLKIHTANGSNFPLKLNVSKINESQAEGLYELYKYRFEDISEGKDKRISELDQEVQDNVFDKFKNEVELFVKNGNSKNDITIKQLIDFVIWDGTQSVKSQVRFNSKKQLLVRDKIYTKDNFPKEEFVNLLTTYKRHQVNYKKRPHQSAKDMHLENRLYLEYIVNNNILNTNALIDAPTFQGRTTMYVPTDTVKVNGKLSKHNVSTEKEYSKQLIGTTATLNAKLAGLYTNPVNLNSDESAYIDKQGREYKRVSTLKDGNIDLTSDILLNFAKRGNVIDLLVRDFFGVSYMSYEDFRKNATKHINAENTKKKQTTIQISDSLYEKLYSILEDYKAEFDRLEFTIWSSSPELSGSLGNKGRFAGTMDLLAFDRKNNEWIIIDLKAATKDRNLFYSGETQDPYNYVKKDAIQQNAYVELFKQRTGIQVSKVWIMPLTSVADPGSSNKFSEIEMSKAGFFLDVDTSKNIYELKAIDKEGKPKEEVARSFALDQYTDDVQEGNEGIINTGFLNEILNQLPTEEKKVMEANKAKPKPKPKSILANTIVISQERQQKMLVDFKNNNYKSVLFKDVQYTITRGAFIIINDETKSAVTDVKQVLAILKEFNRVEGVMFGKLTEDMNVWRTGSKEAVAEAVKPKVIPKPVITEIIDFDNLSEEKATKGILFITKMRKPNHLLKRSREVIMANKNESIQTKFKLLFKLMEEFKLNMDELIKDCQ